MVNLAVRNSSQWTTNAHDPKAIGIYRDSDGRLIGYVPRIKTGFYHALLDGREWPCVIQLYGPKNDDGEAVGIYGSFIVEGLDFSKINVEMLKYPGVSYEDADRKWGEILAWKKRQYELDHPKKEFCEHPSERYVPHFYVDSDEDDYDDEYSDDYGEYYDNFDEDIDENNSSSRHSNDNYISPEEEEEPYNSGRKMTPTDRMDHELWEHQQDSDEYLDFRW